MGIDGSMEHSTHKALSTLGESPSSDDCWTFDEKYYTKMIKAVPNYRAWWWELERHGLHDRIDRSRWPEKPDATGKIDAHLIRPAHERWSELRPLFAQLAPAWLAWADEFVAKYREACQ
jgi:hypothetical protein